MNGFFSELKTLVLKYLILWFQRSVDEIDERDEDKFFKSLDKLDGVGRKKRLSPAEQRHLILDAQDVVIDNMIEERKSSSQEVIRNFHETVSDVLFDGERRSIDEVKDINKGSNHRMPTHKNSKIKYLSFTSDCIYVQDEIMYMTSYSLDDYQERKKLKERLQRNGIRITFEGRDFVKISVGSNYKVMSRGCEIEFVKDSSITKVMPNYINKKYVMSVPINQLGVESISYLADNDKNQLVYVDSEQVKGFFDLVDDCYALRVVMDYYGFYLDWDKHERTLKVICRDNKQGIMLSPESKLMTIPEIPPNFAGTPREYLELCMEAKENVNHRLGLLQAEKELAKLGVRISHDFRGRKVKPIEERIDDLLDDMILNLENKPKQTVAKKPTKTFGELFDEIDRI